MSREANKEAKRERILEAGMQVFIENGFRDGKMEDIAALAGIAKGTLYEYYDSKLHLLREIVRLSVDNYFSRFDRGGWEELNFREQMYRIIDMHCAFVEDNAYLARLLARDVPLHDMEMKDWVFKLNELRTGQLAARIGEAVRCGELRRVDNVLAAQVILAALGAVWMSYVHGDAEKSPTAEDMKAALELVLIGIEK
ncbi:MAG: TetR/AcrR family transcriptional regulator [Syntrophomonadaceae bacterium]|nr:TetR/AcrR family transcriptional regulator [Syntrophomonadaceae bacterium]